jgi:hypothetical protein
MAMEAEEEAVALLVLLETGPQAGLPMQAVDAEAVEQTEEALAKGQRALLAPWEVTAHLEAVVAPLTVVTGQAEAAEAAETGDLPPP